MKPVDIVPLVLLSLVAVLVGAFFGWAGGSKFTWCDARFGSQDAAEPGTP